MLDVPSAYTSWIDWAELNMDDLVFDGVCIGSVTDRLLLIALTPFALVLVVAAALSWAKFRGEILGPTDPAKAPATSLRAGSIEEAAR